MIMMWYRETMSGLEVELRRVNVCQKDALTFRQVTEPEVGEWQEWDRNRMCPSRKLVIAPVIFLSPSRTSFNCVSV